MNQEDSTRRAATLSTARSPTFFTHTDIQAQLQNLLLSSSSISSTLSIDNEHLDQLAAIIRNIHLSKQQDAFLNHLNKFIIQKEAEIEAVSRGHYQVSPSYPSSTEKKNTCLDSHLSVSTGLLGFSR
jgi:hypothetical protein